LEPISPLTERKGEKRIGTVRQGVHQGRGGKKNGREKKGYRGGDGKKKGNFPL